MENSKSTIETIQLLVDLYKYLLKKWIVLVAIGIVCGVIGLLFATFQKPAYVAEITFAPENDNGGSFGSYAGIAAQFGLDLGGVSGGAFEGENLVEFLKSKLMVEKTLLTPVTLNGKEVLLINAYISHYELNKGWNDKSPSLKGFLYPANYAHGDRARDSILKKITKSVSESLDIAKMDKKLNIISAKMQDGNEAFAKLFIENLVNNGINYYVDYKSGKSKQNVSILSHQADSVYSLMIGGIKAVAVGNDLNVNPIRQIVRANVQTKQVDVQVNSRVYEEIVKQLELAKIMLRRETPFIQIIDTPTMPLEKKKMGRLKGIIIFGFVGGFLGLLFFIMRFTWQKYFSAIYAGSK